MKELSKEKKIAALLSVKEILTRLKDGFLCNIIGKILQGDALSAIPEMEKLGREWHKEGKTIHGIYQEFDAILADGAAWWNWGDWKLRVEFLTELIREVNNGK